jgi:serine/threonine protein phosphatase PrpC
MSSSSRNTPLAQFIATSNPDPLLSIDRATNQLAAQRPQASSAGEQPTPAQSGSASVRQNRAYQDRATAGLATIAAKRFLTHMQQVAKLRTERHYGSTLSVGIMEQATDSLDDTRLKISLGWLGDSPMRLILQENNGTWHCIHLNPLHNLKNEGERRRVNATGTMVTDNYVLLTNGDGVAVTRSVGDAKFRRHGVTNEMERGELIVNTEGFKQITLLAASDGMDNVSDEMITKTLQSDPCEADKIAERLVRLSQVQTCRNENKRDDISASTQTWRTGQRLTAPHVVCIADGHGEDGQKTSQQLIIDANARLQNIVVAKTLAPFVRPIMKNGTPRLEICSELIPTIKTFKNIFNVHDKWIITRNTYQGLTQHDKNFLTSHFELACVIAFLEYENNPQKKNLLTQITRLYEDNYKNNNEQETFIQKKIYLSVFNNPRNNAGQVINNLRSKHLSIDEILDENMCPIIWSAILTAICMLTTGLVAAHCSGSIEKPGTLPWYLYACVAADLGALTLTGKYIRLEVIASRAFNNMNALFNNCQPQAATASTPLMGVAVMNP